MAKYFKKTFPKKIRKKRKPPKGFHYMPDGSLMADSNHKSLKRTRK
jgi:hypothetical protein